MTGVKMVNVNIRKAKLEDAPEILKLVNDLALYEKEPEAVKLTIEDLKRDGFGENPYFHCLIGELNGKIEGFSLYFFTWSTWEGCPSLYLEDLYVRETVRGSGLGGRLFKELAKIAVDKGCARFEWSVLDWNKLARDFYHNLGAKHKEGWLPYRLEGEALKTLGS